MIRELLYCAQALLKQGPSLTRVLSSSGVALTAALLYTCAKRVTTQRPPAEQPAVRERPQPGALGVMTPGGPACRLKAGCWCEGFQNASFTLEKGCSSFSARGEVQTEDFTRAEYPRAQLALRNSLMSDYKQLHEQQSCDGRDATHARVPSIGRRLRTQSLTVSLTVRFVTLGERP